VALRGPIRIDGTFKHPHVAPEAGPVALRVAAAVALGALLTPPRRRLADPGGAHDSNCAALIAKGEESVTQPKSIEQSPLKQYPPNQTRAKTSGARRDLRALAQTQRGVERR
jgi:hypothetical protein